MKTTTTVCGETSVFTVHIDVGSFQIEINFSRKYQIAVYSKHFVPSSFLSILDANSSKSVLMDSHT